MAVTKTILEQYRKLAKKANQQFREIERKNVNSPAYRRAQAKLEMAGFKKKGAQGRRFPEITKKQIEKGLADPEKYTYLLRFVKEYTESKTYGIKGARQFMEDVWESAKKRFPNIDHAMTKDEYFEIWESQPTKVSEQIWGSETVVNIVETATKKQNRALEVLAKYNRGEPLTADEERVYNWAIDRGLNDSDNIMTVSEMMDRINKAKNLKDAYNAVGVTPTESYLNKRGNLGSVR